MYNMLFKTNYIFQSNTMKSNRKSKTQNQNELTWLESNYHRTKEKLRAKQTELSGDEKALNNMCQGQECETIIQWGNDIAEEFRVILCYIVFNILDVMTNVKLKN